MGVGEQNRMETIFELCTTYAWVIFVLLVLILKKKTTGAKALGIASDVTTFFLFFAIPILTEKFFEFNLGVYHYIVFVALLMIITTLEWHSKETLHMTSVLKKTWRLLFMICSVAYVCLWLAHWFIP